MPHTLYELSEECNIKDKDFLKADQINFLVNQYIFQILLDLMKATKKLLP
jgi:hypothetical protein